MPTKKKGHQKDMQISKRYLKDISFYQGLQLANTSKNTRVKMVLNLKLPVFLRLLLLRVYLRVSFCLTQLSTNTNFLFIFLQLANVKNTQIKMVLNLKLLVFLRLLLLRVYLRGDLRVKIRSLLRRKRDQGSVTSPRH